MNRLRSMNGLKLHRSELDSPEGSHPVVEIVGAETPDVESISMLPSLRPSG